MKICYVPSDMDAPGFYRCLSPMRQIARHGHSCTLPPYTQKAKDNGALGVRFEIETDPPNPQADIWVVQQRKERDWTSGWIHQLRAHGVATVADVDDNYEELPEWNPAFYGTHPYRVGDGKLNELGWATGSIVNREARRKMRLPKTGGRVNKDHMNMLFTQVDAMTVSTPYLKQLYTKWNKNIYVVRNAADWDMWEDIEPQYEVERWGGRVRIGYLGVFRYRSGDLEVIKRVIPKIMARHPEVDFVANSEETHGFLEIPKRQRVTVKEYHFYPPDGGEFPLGRKTARLDIGLVPLAPGGMSEGKSHLKGMEYNAAGIPYVASNTESYRYWTDEMGNGTIAETPKEWEEKIELLIAEEDVRRTMGKAGRKKAKRDSIQNSWPEWAVAYDKILGDELTAISRGAIVRGAVQKVSELRNLLQLIQDTMAPPKLVVEVGSARGGTFWALGQVAADDALLVSIDIPSGSPLDVREGKDVYEGRDRSRFRSFVGERQRYRLIDGNSQMLATLGVLVDCIGIQKIDVLLIDADHRYEGVRRDYELYSPLVRQGGIIAFHDVIKQNDVRSGVHILWQQLQKKHRETHMWVGNDNWGLGSWGGIGAIVKERSLVRA